MSREIDSIPTEFKGREYRSRTEARWAAFLDALGIDFEYEPKRYALADGSTYLPDFWIPLFKTFLEVKPANETIRDAERTKMERFHAERQDENISCWISRGEPRSGADYIEVLGQGAGSGWEGARIASQQGNPRGYWLTLTADSDIHRPAVFIGGARGRTDMFEAPEEISRIRKAYISAGMILGAPRRDPFEKLNDQMKRW